MKSKMAHTLKSLTSKLHGPLPLTPRASQQLLSQLNASFKKHFDRRNLALSPSPEERANLHIQSILGNPLFDAKHPTRETPTSKPQSIGQSLGQLQNHLTQALDAFRERASQGTADLKMAKLCLMIQNTAYLTPRAANPKQAMQTGGAGSTVLQWLWSSGIEDTGTFLDDPRFVDFLVTSLVAEGQQSRILHWLKRCSYREEKPFLSIANLKFICVAPQLFEVLIRQEICIGEGLESAIDLFIRTVADLRSVGVEGALLKQISIPAAWRLVKTIMYLPSSSEPHPPIFHAFLKTMRSIPPSNRYLDAFLSVYVQENPDPQPALTWFQFHMVSQNVTSFAPHQRYEIVVLGLRVAELFLKDGRQKEALWIMKSLQTRYKPELGLSKSRERDTMLRPRVSRHNLESEDLLRDEEKNLELLDTLTVL